MPEDEEASTRTRDWSKPKASSLSHIPGDFQLSEFLVSRTYFCIDFISTSWDSLSKLQQTKYLSWETKSQSAMFYHGPCWMWKETAPRVCLLGGIWSRCWLWVWCIILSFLNYLRSTEKVGLSWKKWAGWSCWFCHRGKGRSQLCASSAFRGFAQYYLCAMYSSLNQCLMCCEDRGRPEEAYLTPEIRTFECHLGISNELRCREAALRRFGLSRAGAPWRESPLLSFAVGCQAGICVCHAHIHP